MKRRQFIKSTAPVATIGVAGCTSGGSSNGDSGGDSDSNGDSGGGNQNTRYGVPSCSSVDRLVKVRGANFEYDGANDNGYIYRTNIVVEPNGGLNSIGVIMKSFSVSLEDGTEIYSYERDSNDYVEVTEIPVSRTYTFNEISILNQQYDSSKLVLSDVYINAITDKRAEEIRENEDNYLPNVVRKTDNQACY